MRRRYMAEHSHEIVAHLYHVRLPYGQGPDDLEFEPPNSGVDWHGRFTELLRDYKEDEVRRILVGTVALLEKFPHRSLAEALDTAMVWERG
jgi:hypothetical protein